MTDKLTALRELADKVEAGTLECGRELAEICVGEVADYLLVLSAYNGSLDAAKALHDAVLPWWVIHTLNQRHGNVWVAHLWEVGGDGWHGAEMRKIEEWNKCPARAWLLAVLRALLAQLTPQEEG